MGGLIRPAKLFFWPGSTDFTKNFLSIFKDEKYTPTPPVNQFLLGKGPLQNDPGADKRQIGTFFPSIIFWRVQLIPYFSNRFPEENSILLTYTTQKNQNSLDLCGFTIDFAKINQKTCLLIEIIIKKSQHGTFSPYILKKVNFFGQYVIDVN